MKASEIKKELAKRLKTEKPKKTIVQFIPLEFGLNLANLLIGARSEADIECNFMHAWIAANEFARMNGITDVSIKRSTYEQTPAAPNMSFAKGTLVFVGTKTESQSEMEHRLINKIKEEAAEKLRKEKKEAKLRAALGF